MPYYDYYCQANGKTVAVNHPMDVNVSTWGELCYVTQRPLGDTAPSVPVKKLIRAPALAFPTGNAELKAHGFTKLVKRDDGVYENVTRTADEKRYMRAGDPTSIPQLNKKIED